MAKMSKERPGKVSGLSEVEYRNREGEHEFAQEN